MTDFNKLRAVFKSCRSEAHLDVAIKYANLTLLDVPQGREWITFQIEVVRYVERLIGHTAGRLNVDL